MKPSVKSGRWLLMLIFCWLSPFIAAETPVYKIAIVPQYSPVFIYQHWRPLIEELESKMGVRFEIQTYKNFKQFIEALQNGEPDFSYLSPYHLVLARKHQNYVPLLRNADKQLVGQVIVRQDSALKNINELQGKTIAFPSPDAFAASLYLRAWLREKLNIDFTPRYVGTHDNVYRNVVRNFVSAGGGVNTTITSQPASLRKLLRVLYEIPGVASHPIATHRRVPLKVQSDLVKNLKLLMDTEAGLSLLRQVQMPSLVRADYDRDYAFLEKLDLEKYRGNTK